MKLRETGLNTGRLTAADLVIDFDAGTVEKDGRTLVLPDLTWRTLCCLAARKGAIVTIEELIEFVWGDTGVSNETVSQRIKLLRRELGDDGQNPRYIGTVRNRGFRFLPKPVATTGPVATDAKASRPLRVTAPTVTLALSLAMAAILVAVVVYGQFAGTDGPRQPESELVRIIGRGGEYLSRLQREDNQLAISLFEEALRRDSNNRDALLGLSFAVSHNASKFNYPLDWARRGELLARRAVEMGPSARAFHALAFALDAQGKMAEAITYYEQGLSLEPDNPAILGSAAYSYQLQGQLARALDYGMKAHALNPDVPFSEIQVAATLHLLERDAEAREWFARGLILKPDNIFIYSAKASVLFALGRDAAVQETIEQASAMSIERPELYVLQGLVATVDGRMDAARASFLAANRVSPSRQTGEAYRIWLDMMTGNESARKEAQAWIDKSRGTMDSTALLVVAGLYGGLGEMDTAIKTLNEAVDAGYRDWRSVTRHPMFSELQGTPQFALTVQRMRRLIAAEQSKTGNRAGPDG